MLHFDLMTEKCNRKKGIFNELSSFAQNIDVAPGLYETQNYQTINAPIEAAKFV